MRVLVSGGGGVIRTAVVQELLNRRHVVRLLSLDGDEARQWPAIELFRGDVADGASIHGCCAGCDAVLAFDDTGNLAEEARLANVRKLFFAHSADDRDASSWTNVRHTHMYGPGDDIVTPLVKMIHSSPVIPVIHDGDKALRLVWHEDFAKALVTILESDVDGSIDIAGEETTSIDDIVARLKRNLDGNTRLDEHLRTLVDALPEQLADEGVGALRHKRFWAEIEGARMRAASLMSLVREKFGDIMPLDVEPEPLAVGKPITMSLPMRGNVQVRVEAVEPTRLVLATLEGHALAGTVQFSTSEDGDRLVFTIEVHARAANVIDWLAVTTIGAPLQDANWVHVVQRVVKLSGGEARDGVQSLSEKLHGEEAEAAERRMRSIVYARRREESARKAEDAAQR